MNKKSEVRRFRVNEITLIAFLISPIIPFTGQTAWANDLPLELGSPSQVQAEVPAVPTEPPVADSNKLTLFCTGKGCATQLTPDQHLSAGPIGRIAAENPGWDHNRNPRPTPDPGTDPKGDEICIAMVGAECDSTPKVRPPPENRYVPPEEREGGDEETRIIRAPGENPHNRENEYCLTVIGGKGSCNSGSDSDSRLIKDPVLVSNPQSTPETSGAIKLGLFDKTIWASAKGTKRADRRARRRAKGLS